MRWVAILSALLYSSVIVAQNNITYNADTDTLLIINGKVITTSNYLMDRGDLIANDTLFVNKGGLVVEEFVVSSFTLGQKIAAKNQGNVFSEFVLSQLTKNESVFKFFYLKDIILRSTDGRTCQPSSEMIKITFTN